MNEHNEKMALFEERHPWLNMLAKIGAVCIFIAILALINGVVLAFELLPMMLMLTGKW